PVAIEPAAIATPLRKSRRAIGLSMPSHRSSVRIFLSNDAGLATLRLARSRVDNNFFITDFPRERGRARSPISTEQVCVTAGPRGNSVCANAPLLPRTQDWHRCRSARTSARPARQLSGDKGRARQVSTTADPDPNPSFTDGHL